MNYKEYKEYLLTWMQKEVKKANLKGVVVGISGGVDSAVVATLAKEAFPNNSLGIIMPIINMKNDFQDAKQLIKQINIKSLTIDLSNTYKNIVQALSIEDKFVNGNIKPRLRMTTLYAIAQEKKYLVLGTDNADEWFLGYFTKYGDGGTDILPIIHMNKLQVKEMAQFLNISKKIYQKNPSAALWDGQKDEDELGFTYQDVYNYLHKKLFDKKIIDKILKQHLTTQHKRQSLPTPKKPW